MFSLSTSWNSRLHDDGCSLIKEIRRAGLDSVELSFALSENVVNDILSLKERGAIKVSSLHNICPLPNEVEIDEASPDYYSLASPDEEERKLAVDATKNTILYAKKFDAKAVVLHAGRVQTKDRTRDLASLINEGNRFNALKEEMIKERESKIGGYLRNVIKSLSELIPYAKEMNVSLGIENRYYYREIPLMDELLELFATFEIGSLYYWHDVGHAEVFEHLGLGRHLDFLQRFSNRLLGIHLHDIIGAVNDHRPPGSGEFDFRILKPFVKEDTIKVLEVHQPASIAEVRRSVQYLRKIFE